MSDTQKLNDLLHLAHTRVLNAEELESLNALNGGLAELLGLQFTHVGPREARAKLQVLPEHHQPWGCLLYTSPSPRDVEESRMPSSA